MSKLEEIDVAEMRRSPEALVDVDAPLLCRSIVLVPRDLVAGSVNAIHESGYRTFDLLAVELGGGRILFRRTIDRGDLLDGVVIDVLPVSGCAHLFYSNNDTASLVVGHSTFTMSRVKVPVPR